jgi:hypothetical protein
MPANPWHHERRTRIPRTAAPRQHPRLRCCVKRQRHRRPVSTARRASRRHHASRARLGDHRRFPLLEPRKMPSRRPRRKVVDFDQAEKSAWKSFATHSNFSSRRCRRGRRSRLRERQQRSYERKPRAPDRTHAASSATALTHERVFPPRARRHIQHERDEDRATPWPLEAARSPRPYAPQQGVARGAILPILSVECPGTTPPTTKRHERERPPPRPNRRDRADTAPDTVK